MFRYCLFFTFLFLLLVQPVSGQENGKKPLQRYKLSIGKLRKEMDRHAGKIHETQKKEKTILEELEGIDLKLESQQLKIAELQEQIDQQDLLIQTKQAEINAIDREKADLQEHLINRLKAYYFMGKTNLLDVTFSRKNLPDLLLFDDAFHRLITYDREVFDAYREKKTQLINAKQAYELEKEVQVDFLHQAEEEKKILDYIAEEKNALLKKTKNQKNLYAQALKEMQKAEGQLTGTIIQLKEKQEKRSKGFLRSKGKLPPPVSGKLLSGFQARKDEDTPLNNGITIKTRDGAKVHAVYGGSIVYSGYMKGFGKTVIIDHGRQYYTVTSRLDNLIVKKDDKVKSGQMIGTTGDIATLFGRGLYFEIRHGATSENPLQWLKKGSY
ncbi:MAG: hypothetical protein CSB34_06935 [Desulfobulbus propionicus]|nr:MAG: hypothetical protein CSB34_06935 [Desulfobulbus propionicus]